MEVRRSELVQIFTLLGHQAAETWSDSRLLNKAGRLNSSVDEDTSLDDNELDNVLDEIIGSLNDGESIDLIEDDEEDVQDDAATASDDTSDDEVDEVEEEGQEDVEEEEAPKAKKKGKKKDKGKAKGKAKPKATRERKPTAVRANRYYIAGQVILASNGEASGGVTKKLMESMTTAVEAAGLDPHATQDRGALRKAWHAINGYNKVELTAE